MSAAGPGTPGSAEQLAVAGKDVATSLILNGGLWLAAVLAFDLAARLWPDVLLAKSVARARAAGWRLWRERHGGPAGAQARLGQPELPGPTPGAAAPQPPRQARPGGPGPSPGPAGFDLPVSSWLESAFVTPDSVVLATAGADGLTLLWATRMGLELFAAVSVLCLGVLLPVNWTAAGGAFTPAAAGGGGGDAQMYSYAFERTTASNIPQEDPGGRKWVHFVAVYVISWLAIWRLHAHTNRVTAMRARTSGLGPHRNIEWAAAPLQQLSTTSAASPVELPLTVSAAAGSISRRPAEKPDAAGSGHGCREAATGPGALAPRPLPHRPPSAGRLPRRHPEDYAVLILDIPRAERVLALPAMLRELFPATYFGTVPVVGTVRLERLRKRLYQLRARLAGLAATAGLAPDGSRLQLPAASGAGGGFLGAAAEPACAPCHSTAARARAAWVAGEGRAARLARVAAREAGRVRALYRAASDVPGLVEAFEMPSEAAAIAAEDAAARRLVAAGGVSGFVGREGEAFLLPREGEEEEEDYEGSGADSEMEEAAADREERQRAATGPGPRALMAPRVDVVSAAWDPQEGAAAAASASDASKRGRGRGPRPVALWPPSVVLPGRSGTRLLSEWDTDREEEEEEVEDNDNERSDAEEAADNRDRRRRAAATRGPGVQAPAAGRGSELSSDEEGSGRGPSAAASAAALERALLLEGEEDATTGSGPARLRPSAFALFRSPTAARAAAAIFLVGDGRHWRARPAPPPRGVAWAALRLGPARRRYRALVADVSLWAFILLAYLPVSAITAAANIESLARLLPGLRGLAGRWALVGVLAGFLPALVLLVFYMLVWRILYALAKARGADASLAGLDRRVGSTLALFLLLNGLVISQLASAIADPSAVLRLLSMGMPRTAAFFTTYLLALAALQQAAELYSIGLLARDLITGGPCRRRRQAAREAAAEDAAPAGAEAAGLGGRAGGSSRRGPRAAGWAPLENAPVRPALAAPGPAPPPDREAPPRAASRPSPILPLLRPPVPPVQSPPYGLLFAYHTLVMALGLAYAWLCPLLPVAALCYFAAALLTWRVKLLHTAGRAYESRGSHWRFVWRWSLAAVGLFQWLSLVLLALDGSPAGLTRAVLVLPAFLALMAYRARHAGRLERLLAAAPLTPADAAEAPGARLRSAARAFVHPAARPSAGYLPDLGEAWVGFGVGI